MRPPYSFSTSESGLTFLAIGLGVLLGGLTGVLVDHTMYQSRHRAALSRGDRNAAPEHRLYNAMLGCWGILVGLFWVGWSAAKGAHWAVVLVGSVPFAWGNLCLFVSVPHGTLQTTSRPLTLHLDKCSTVHDRCIWSAEWSIGDCSQRDFQIYPWGSFSLVHRSE